MRYLGPENAATEATAQWLENAIGSCPPREQTLALATFADLRALTPAELARVERILTDTTAAGREPSTESNTILYLRAAVVARHPAVIPQLVSWLAQSQKDSGQWVDLTTTGSAVSALLDARALLSESANGEEAISQIETMALRAVIHILDGLDPAVLRDATSVRAYPWQDRASTSVTCLLAWIQFDALIHIPVREVVDTLRRDERAATEAASLRTVLAVLQEIKSEATELRRQLNDSQQELTRARQARTRARNVVVVAGVLTYVLVTLLAGLASARGTGGLATAFRRGIVDAWAVHVGVIAAAAAILAIPWDRWLSRKRENDTPR
jgi:hypothetical protein